MSTNGNGHHKQNPLKTVGQLLQTRFRWQHPLYLIHSLTARCNATCKFCAWYDCEPQGELSTEEIKQLYRDAKDAGLIGLSIWGGEPLVHRDVGELCRYAKEIGLITHMVTNGVLLERKMDEVLPYLDRLCISVDHPSSQHDDLRGVPGLYAKILDATRLVRQRYPKTKIIYVCTMLKDHAAPKALRELAEVARSLGVVVVYNAMRIEAASADTEETTLERFNPTQAELSTAFATIRELKENGYPILNSFTHLDMMRKGPPEYRCHWPKFMLPIEANGDVVDCMHWGTRPLGNIRDTPFAEILKSRRLRDLAGPVGEACHKCVSLHRVEISEICEGRFEPLLSWAAGLATDERLPATVLGGLSQRLGKATAERAASV